jgi:GT2 family glycosyltransferase
LKEASSYAGIELKLIFVDNNSQDGSYEVLSRFVKGLGVESIVLRASRNWGFAGGVNLGYAIVDDIDEYDYLTLLNNDAVVNKHGLREIVNAIDEYSLGGAQGVIRRPRGEIDNVGGMLDEFLLSHSIKIVGSRRMIFPTYLNGAFSVYNTSVLRKCIGTDRLFFEFLPAFFDDNVLGLRLWNCGSVLAALPTTAAWHMHGATFSKYPTYRVYNFVMSYVALMNTVYTRYRRLLPMVLAKFILREAAKARRVKSAVDTIFKAVRDGMYYGYRLRSMGLMLDLYKAPHIQLEDEEVLMSLFSPRMGLNRITGTGDREATRSGFTLSR